MCENGWWDVNSKEMGTLCNIRYEITESVQNEVHPLGPDSSVKPFSPAVLQNFSLPSASLQHLLKKPCIKKGYS